MPGPLPARHRLPRRTWRRRREPSAPRSPHGLGRKQACALPDPRLLASRTGSSTVCGPARCQGPTSWSAPPSGSWGAGGAGNSQNLSASPGQDTRGSSFDMALFSDRPSVPHPAGAEGHPLASSPHGGPRAYTSPRVLPARGGRAGWALSKQSGGRRATQQGRESDTGRKGCGSRAGRSPGLGSRDAALPGRGLAEGRRLRMETETQPPGACPPQRAGF